jgi:hypothetical protein
MWFPQQVTRSFTKKGPGRRHNGSRANPPGSKLARKAAKQQIGIRKQS